MIANSNAFSFEIETAYRTYAFGCEDELTREKWVTALTVAREISIVNNSTYKMQLDAILQLNGNEIIKFAEMFKKQGALFNAIVLEKQAPLIPTQDDFGFNTEDIHEISTFLQQEMLAAGLSNKLLSILQEFLLIPAGASVAWTAICDGVKKVRKVTERIINSGRYMDNGNEDGDETPSLSLDECFDEEEENIVSFSELLRKKGEESGSAYAEVSRLAVSVISKDQQNADLRENITKLEQKIEKLKLDNAATSMTKTAKLAAQLSEIEAELESEKLRAKSLEDRVKEVEELLLKQKEEFEASTAKYEAKNSEHLTAIEELRKQLFEKQNEQPNLHASTDSSTIIPVTTTTTTTPSVIAVNGTPEEDKLKKYKKMLKVLPDAAVRHKMSLDKFSSEEIDAFFASHSPVPPPSSASFSAKESSSSTETDGLDKYRRLKKVLSEESVRKKMADDGNEPHTIETFFHNIRNNNNLSNQVDSELFETPKKVEFSEKFAKYERMKKVLPLNTVRQKMINDGFPLEEIQAYLGDKVGSESSGVSSGEPKVGSVTKAVVEEGPPEGMEAKVTTLVPSVKLKGLFWTKLKPSEINGTLFYKLFDFSLPSSLLSDVDTLFAARVPQSTPATPATDENGNPFISPSASNRLISILDSKRVQSILIFMSKLKRNPEEIMGIIIELDPDVLTHELTNTLLKILPTAEEANALHNFPDPSRLDEASQFCFYVNRIPRVNARLQCHEIAFSWYNAISSVSTQLGILQSACDELNQAQKHMESVFAMILSLGNYLNAGTKWGNAYGFQLDTVNKLSTLKAAKSNHGSLIHVLATLVTVNIPELLPISQSWVAIAAATEVSLQQILSEVSQLDQQVNRMNSEFVKIREGRENPGLDGQLETSKGPVTHPLQKRLDQFLRYSKPKMTTVKALAKAVEANVAAMMSLYGLKLVLHIEEDACKGFFSVISNFFRSLRTAADENIKRKKALEKAAREAATAKAKQEKAELKKSASTESTPVRKTERPTTIRRSRPMPKDNIFDSFHCNQEAVTNAVVNEFLNKRQRYNIKSLRLICFII